MKSFGTSHIKIKVYANDHPPPHCHVIRGGVVTRLCLPTLEILTGPSLSKVEEELVLEKLDEICDEFEKQNPKKNNLSI